MKDKEPLAAELGSLEVKDNDGSGADASSSFSIH